MSTGRSCKYCKRPYLVSDDVFAENPFCSKCLHERISITAFAHVNEQLADLARLAGDLVDALPGCEIDGCRQVATRSFYSTLRCDEHRLKHEFRPSDQETSDHSYAAPLRALQAKLATLDGAAGCEAKEKT